jgi:capsid protein
MQVQNPSWRPRGWQYFDPTKEIAANVEGLKNKLLRLRDVIEENGGDFEEHLRGIAADEAFAKSIGLELTYDIDDQSSAAAGRYGGRARKR